MRVGHSTVARLRETAYSGHTLCIFVEGSGDIVEYLLAYDLPVLCFCCLQSMFGVSTTTLAAAATFGEMVHTNLNLRSISRDSFSSTQLELSISTTIVLALLNP
jgi:hypothetical protein